MMKKLALFISLGMTLSAHIFAADSVDLPKNFESEYPETVDIEGKGSDPKDQEKSPIKFLRELKDSPFARSKNRILAKNKIETLTLVQLGIVLGAYQHDAERLEGLKTVWLTLDKISKQTIRDSKYSVRNLFHDAESGQEAIQVIEEK